MNILHGEYRRFQIHWTESIYYPEENHYSLVDTDTYLMDITFPVSQDYDDLCQICDKLNMLNEVIDINLGLKQ